MALNLVFDTLNRQDIAVVGEVAQFFPAVLVKQGTPIGFLQENGALIPLKNTEKVIRETAMSLAVAQAHRSVTLGVWPELYYRVQQMAEERGFRAVLSCEHGGEEYALQYNDKTVACVDQSGVVHSEDRQLKNTLSQALQEKQTGPGHLRISYQLGLQKAEIKALAALVAQGKVKVEDAALQDAAKRISRQEYDEFGNMIQPDLTEEQASKAQQFLADENQYYRLEADPDKQEESEQWKKEMESKYGTSDFDEFNRENCGGKYQRDEARFTDAQLEQLLVKAKTTGLYDTKSTLSQRLQQAAARHKPQKQEKADTLKDRVAQKKEAR